jgi:hypothetical protein
LASDFDRVVNLFKDYIAQKRMGDKNNKSAANIATVGGKSGKKDGSKPDGKNKKRKAGANVSAVQVQDRYYTREEYNKLSPEEKQALHDLRKKRQNKGSSSSTTVAQVSAGDQIIQAIAAAVSSRVIEQGSGTATNSDDDETAVTSNRSNPALRQHSTSKRS